MAGCAAISDLRQATRRRRWGCLFFACRRTSDQKVANLQVYYSSCNLSGSISLPGNKTQKVECDQAFTPQIPLLVNGAKIPANTELVAMDDMVLNAARVKQQEERAAELAAFAENNKRCE